VSDLPVPHVTLLQLYRCAASMNWAILAGIV